MFTFTYHLKYATIVKTHNHFVEGILYKNSLGASGNVVLSFEYEYKPAVKTA